MHNAFVFTGNTFPTSYKLVALCALSLFLNSPDEDPSIPLKCWKKDKSWLKDKSSIYFMKSAKNNHSSLQICDHHGSDLQWLVRTYKRFIIASSSTKKYKVLTQITSLPEKVCSCCWSAQLGLSILHTMCNSLLCWRRLSCFTGSRSKIIVTSHWKIWSLLVLPKNGHMIFGSGVEDRDKR